MPATATAKASAPARRAPARRTPARRAPARRAPARTPAKRRPATARAGSSHAALRVPVAVGRTAVAVGGLADSGVVLRLTRGRLWIGALAALLVGIVALNVVALSFTASSSDVAREADALGHQNSALRAEVASQLSNERLQRAAAKLGLSVPEPGAIRYLTPSPEDAAEAARRLRAGELGVSAPVVPIAAPLEPEVPAPTEDPVAPEAEAVEPVEPVEPAPPEAVAPADEAAAAPAAGGVATP